MLMDLFAFPRYIEQLVASAEAAVNEIVRRGVSFSYCFIFMQIVSDLLCLMISYLLQ
jgi:hypothetical protein